MHIKVKRHETYYLTAVESLKSRSPLPLKGDWKLSEVVKAFNRFRAVMRPGWQYPVPEFEFVVHLLAWAQRPHTAQRQLEEYMNEMRGWPADIMQRDGGLDTWRASMLAVIDKGPSLQQVAEEEAKLLKADKLPMSRLIVDIDGES